MRVPVEVWRLSELLYPIYLLLPFYATKLMLNKANYYNHFTVIIQNNLH